MAGFRHGDMLFAVRAWWPDPGFYTCPLIVAFAWQRKTSSRRTISGQHTVQVIPVDS